MTNVPTITTHPEVVIVGVALCFMAWLALIVWCASPPKVTKAWPRETLRDRLAMNIFRLPVWLQPWASALHTIMCTCDRVVHVNRTEREFEEMAYRFACVLGEATGGKMSKTNYDMATMSGVIQEFQQDMLDDRMVDFIADLPNFEFPWPRVKVLCQYAEVSVGKVAERRRQKKEMSKLVAQTRRERARAAKAEALDIVGSRVHLANGNAFKYLVDGTN